MFKLKNIFWLAGCLLTLPLVTVAYSGTTVASVSSSLASGIYQVGQIIPITVRFTAPVTVMPYLWNSCGVASTTGCDETRAYPQLILALDNDTTTALFDVSSDGTQNLIFNYTVATGQTANPLDYASTTSLTHNQIDPSQVTMRDGVGDPVNLTLPIPGTASALSPSLLTIGLTGTSTVLNVSATQPNGTLKADDTVTIKVFFNQNVVVTPYVWRSYNPTRRPRWSVAQYDYPALALRMDNGATRYATYVSGSGTGVLSFQYIVQSGDRTDDLTYGSTDALSFRREYLSINNPTTGAFYVEDSVGSIKNSVAEDVSLILPTPGASGSLSYNKNIKTNTDAPSLVVNGVIEQQIPLGDTYVEAGATASDLVDGNLTSSVVVNSNVNTDRLGNYTVTYTVTNSANNQTTGQRTVFVHNNLSGLPVNNTSNTGVNVTVGGGSAYLYQIDSGVISSFQSISASSTITSDNLSIGEHVLRIWGKNVGEDSWQVTPYIHLWTIKEAAVSGGGGSISINASDVDLLSAGGMVATVASSSGQVLGAKVYKFNRILRLGSKGDDVKLLQFLLIKQKVGKSATALSKVGMTGYYGQLTERAMRDYAKVKKLKPANGILNKFVWSHFQKLGQDLNLSLAKISSKQSSLTAN